MHIKESKITIAIEFQLSKILQDGILYRIGVSTLHTKCILYACIINISNILTQIIIHANLIKLLQTVLKTIIVIVCSTFPKEL